MNETVHVKLEPECESSADSCGVSEVATYTSHVVKKLSECESSADSCRVREAATFDYVVKLKKPVLESEQRQPIAKALHGEFSTAQCDGWGQWSGLSSSEHDSLLQIHTNTLQHVAETSTYVCDFCGHTFQQKHRLIRHVKVHLDANSETLPNKSDKRTKKYPCRICKKKFRTGYLKIHERTHTGEKPYACEVCKKEFSILGNLREHKRVHTEERPYTCDTCQKTFSRSGHLKVHKRIHSREMYQCEVCKKEFAQLGNLRSHKLVHTGEKPFTCEVCKKNFRQLSNLKSHKRTHSNQ